MASKILTKNSRLSSAFLNAMSIAGFLTAVMVCSLLYAMITRHPPLASATPAAAPAELPTIGTSTTLPPVIEPQTPATETPPASPDPIPTAAPDPTPEVKPKPVLTPISRMMIPDLSQIADDPATKIDDWLVAKYVEGGATERQQGNLQKSLETLLSAEQNLPHHPRILSEIATTYMHIGDQTKAQSYWQSVVDEGAIVSGPYYQVAEKVLRGENPSLRNYRRGQTLQLGQISELKTPASADGEWVTLKIPIHANPDVRPSASLLNLKVDFFDLINGKTPGPTIAKIDKELTSMPYDWRDNLVEQIEVIYHLPILSVAQRKIQGDRAYYGYSVKLYYDNQIQDSVVSDDSLREFRFPTAPVSPAPAPAAAPAMQPSVRGPDTSLFPINR